MIQRLCVLWALLCTAPMLAAETLTLVSENDWYPYAAERNGEARGLSVDLVRAAYAAVGVDVEFKVMSYARCMELLNTGEEVGCFNTPDDADIRAQQKLPQHALDTDLAYVYTRAESPQASLTLEQLAGKAVGIVNGYRYGDAFMHDPMILREFSASDLQNLKKLAAGRLDYIVLYERVARYLMGIYGGQLELKIKPVTPIGDIAIFVSFSPLHPRAEYAREMFDRGMSLLKSSGGYASIVSRWDAQLTEGVAVVD